MIRFISLLLLVLTSAFWNTVAFAAPTILGSQDTFYPRMIRLAASGAANGRLIASFDYDGNQSTIHESTNDGASWTQVGTLATPETWHCCSGLYEMPQAVGSTTKGTLLWATTTRNGSNYAIRIYKSTDLGRNWSALSVPATGSSGIWEPEFVVDNAGRLLMFYSSEEYKASGYNQLIAHKVSTDGGLTWSGDIIDIGVSDNNDKRPGMAVVRKLPNGSWVMSYEICGSLGCNAYLRTSNDGSSWGAASNMGTRIESTAGTHFAHSPTITWFNDGSANGQLVVTGQVLKNNSDNTIVEDRNGRTLMFNSANGSGNWTESATPLTAPSAGGADACTNYSTQLLQAANGRIVEMANIGCRIHVASAPFANPVQDGVYRIVARHSNQVLDVSSCSGANGANVQQWPWIGGDCQRWRLVNLGNGDYTIAAQHSGQALDVAGCSISNGANVQQWPSNGADCQKWKLEPVGNGDYRVVSKKSGLALDVSGCSGANGANVQQWAWNGGDCQRWRFERVSANTLATGGYKIAAKHSGQVLDVAGCSTTNGANVQQWPWNGANCQIWNLVPTSDGFFELVSRMSSQRLDVAQGGLLSGANVQQWPSNNASPQRWSVESAGVGYWRVVNKNSGKVLDVNACSAASGANVQQWEWLSTDCQRWQFTAVP